MMPPSSFFPTGCCCKGRTRRLDQLLSTNSSAWRIWGAPSPERAPHSTAWPLAQPCHPPDQTPRQPVTKTAEMSFFHLRDAQQSSSRCWSWARRRAPWANRAGQAKQRPDRLHPCLQGARAAAWTAKCPGRQGTGWAPSYGAALVPKANGGSFSPIPGHPDHDPANGAVTPHRLPAEHKGSQTCTPDYRQVDTQGAPELGLPPHQQERLLSSQAVERHSQWPGAGTPAPITGRARPAPTHNSALRL